MINTAKAYLAAIYTSWLPIIIYLFGGLDGLLITLWVMMILDYASGILKGFKRKNINSNSLTFKLKCDTIFL